MNQFRTTQTGVTLLELIVLITVGAIVIASLFIGLRSDYRDLIDYPTLTRIANNALDIAKSRIYIDGDCGAQTCPDGPLAVHQTMVDCDPTKADLPLGFCRISLGEHLRYTIMLTAQPINVVLESLPSIPMWEVQAQLELFIDQSATMETNWRSIAHLNLTTALSP